MRLQVHASHSLALHTDVAHLCLSSGAISHHRLQVEELYDLDSASMDRLKPIFGLVFLFKWRKETDPRPVLEEAPEGVFFAKQMVLHSVARHVIPRLRQSYSICASAFHIYPACLAPTILCALVCIMPDGVAAVIDTMPQIDNACATQAIINCLLNRPDIDVGPDLGAFREFTSALPAEVWLLFFLWVDFCFPLGIPVFTCLRLRALFCTRCEDLLSTK